MYYFCTKFVVELIHLSVGYLTKHKKMYVDTGHRIFIKQSFETLSFEDKFSRY